MPAAKPSERVGLYAYLNASFQSGYSNPIDAAIVAVGRPESSGYRKLDEEPYDFVRKRLSVLVAGGGKNLLVTKGALASVLEVCTTAEAGPGDVVDLDAMRPQIERQFAEFSGQGLRTLGVAYRDMGSETGIHKGHEAGMTFLGLLGPRRPAPGRDRRDAPEPPRPRCLHQAHHRGQPPGRRPRRPAGRACRRRRSSRGRTCDMMSDEALLRRAGRGRRLRRG